MAALSGTVALATWGAAGLGPFNASYIENTASLGHRAPTPHEPAMSVGEAAAGDSGLPEPFFAPADSSAAEVPAVEPALTDAAPKPPPETGVQLASAPTSDPVDDGPRRPPETGVQLATSPTSDPVDNSPKPPPETGVQLASAPTFDPVDAGPKPPVRSIEPPHQCVAEACIDEYLWSLYERAPKIDTIKVPERIKVTVKKKGKTRTVTQTVMTLVVEDFTWKDPVAAQRRGMSLMDYVIGGMDHGFRLKLYRALRAMDDAGLMPGITSGFRDDYRQSIAAGLKASPDSSYHGGSRRGGYRHGLAADLVSVKGDTRMERYAASEELWKWIDAHEKEYGIGRPYLDHDPPHVGPVDGAEYTVKRSLANARRLALQRKAAEKPRLETTRRELAARATIPARRSVQTRQNHRS